MGFSVKLAPGVRVRMSSRGVRTSIGPRIARVHVGSGRSGISTGVGPFGYYTSLGGRRSRPTARTSSSSSRTGTAAAQRQLAAAERAADKQGQANALEDAINALMTIHQHEFPLAVRPIAPPAPPIDPTPFNERHVAEAKATTSAFDRAARRAALAEAERRTAIDVNNAAEHLERQRAEYQRSLDEWWRAVFANDPGTVLHALAEAFEDNDAAAAAIGLEGAELTLVVVVPHMSSIPERKRCVTAAGNLSLKKLTKGERVDLYTYMVCGHVLVTVKEAFAVAPSVRSARIVALRTSDRDAYGRIRPEPLLAARFERSAFDGIRWTEADAARIVVDASTELLVDQRGATQELTPLDLSSEPDIAAALTAIDVEAMS